MKKSAVYLKTISLFLFANFLFLISIGQWYDPDKVNEKAREVYTSAYEKAVERNYTASLKLLEEALRMEPKFVEVYLSRAGIYAEMKNYQHQLMILKQGLKWIPSYSATYLLPYSISLAGTGQFGKALVAVNGFLNTPKLNEQSIKAGNYRKSVYEFAVDYEKKHPADNYVFAPENLGDSINSKALEYYPSLTIDGKK